MNQIFVPDKTLFPFQFYPVQSHRLEPSFLCRKRNQLNKVNKNRLRILYKKVSLLITGQLSFGLSDIGQVAFPQVDV